ncbi:MAG: NADP-dependent isocitrate dehydrogenase, partial [Bacteroidota bacterium]
MRATLRVLKAAGASISPVEIEIGEKAYRQGHSAGITPKAWDRIRAHKILLKAPITTPQGGGYKSLNVTLRKSLGLFANIRPCRSWSPFVETLHPNLDIIVVRENEEDLYAGIEHQQTPEVVQCLKLISRPGCERIIRYAFEYARAHGRHKVTCMVKDNIMKLTDGLFHRVFKEIGALYPDIKQEVQIIDIGTARLADTPERYDVVVTSNLYGDIVSDVVAQLTGSVGLAGSANIGTECAMFEAIHGSAPDIAGRGIANPSGLLHGAIMMLVHLGQQDVANRIFNAWQRTIEDGIHPADIYTEGSSNVKVGTAAFADAVIARLGKKPDVLLEKHFPQRPPIQLPTYQPPRVEKQLVGVDVFIDWRERDAQRFGEHLALASTSAMQLKMITNRGVKVFPNGLPETFCTDHWRCRFVSQSADIQYGKAADYPGISFEDILELLTR